MARFTYCGVANATAVGNAETVSLPTYSSQQLADLRQIGHVN